VTPAALTFFLGTEAKPLETITMTYDDRMLRGVDLLNQIAREELGDELYDEIVAERGSADNGEAKAK
jgi:hypothetical protein